MDYAAQLSMVLPEIILGLGGVALLMVAAWGGTNATRAVSWASVAVLLGAGLSLFGAPSSGNTAFDGLYRADLFSAYAKALIFGATAVSIIVAPRFFARSNGADLRPEYPILMLFAAAGMGIMVSANDMMTLYIGLELNSLASYVLASFMRRDVRSAESGLKYFILGSLASGILLYGISLVYGFSGTTIFGDIATAYAAGTNTGLLFGLVFVFAGLAFKMSAVPFHMWTPDVYEGAPTPVTAFFASAPKVAAVALTARVAIEAMGPAFADWQQILIFAALASIILGSVAGVAQKNIKRLLAYSSIANVGFALIGLASGTVDGVAAVLVFLTIYVVMTIGSFLIVLQMRDADGNAVENISDLAGLARTRPALAAAMAFFMFSVAGIPPLFGFWAKFSVFAAAVNAGLIWLAAIGIAASAIGAFYYLRVIKTMYFDEPAATLDSSKSVVEQVLIVLAVLFVSPLGYLLITPIETWALAAAQSLF